MPRERRTAGRTKQPKSKPHGTRPERAPQPAHTAEEREDRLDEMLKDSFPASDPPALSSLHDDEGEPDGKQ